MDLEKRLLSLMSNPQKLTPTSFERFLDKYVLPNVPEPERTAALMLPGIVVLAAIERLMKDDAPKVKPPVSRKPTVPSPVKRTTSKESTDGDETPSG